jgi:carbon storage regulator
MLVLSRQKEETIMIGDNIEITIVDIRGDKVRLGITAPQNIPVHRKEVYDAIKQENKQAANIKLEDITDTSPQPPNEGKNTQGRIKPQQDS